jgi:hypothetical protein
VSKRRFSDGERMPGEITPEEDKKAPWIHPKKKKRIEKRAAFMEKKEIF